MERTAPALDEGLYGLRLHVVGPHGPLPGLRRLETDAPVLDVRVGQASALHDEADTSLARHVEAHRGGGRLVVEPDRLELDVPTAFGEAALVHPVLTTGLAYVSHLRGHATLHGGAFLADGRAWAVIGAREAGKSTTLAALAARGVPVLADDLVVVDRDAHVLAGPACVDLRTDAARHFGAERVGVVGGRERWRVGTAEAPARVPFGGLVVLGWGDAATDLPPADRVRVLHAQHYAGPLGPPAPALVLGLVERPMWRFERPRDWGRLDEALDGLLALVSGA
jgi:hypothetical protein